MGSINSKSAARRRVREAQLRAHLAREERERQNVDDAASLLMELGRLAGVEEWEATRILEIQAEAERRRHAHRQAGGCAVARMQGRGESLAAIAQLAGVKVGNVRTLLKAASAHDGASAQALGDGNGALPQSIGPNVVTAHAGDVSPQALGGGTGAGATGEAAQALGANGITAQADGVSAQVRGGNGTAPNDDHVGGRA